MSRNEALINTYQKLEIDYPKDRDIVGTPGGPLFTSIVAGRLGISVENDEKVELGRYEFSGQALKDIVAYYDMLQEGGSILVCMDPRIDGLDNAEQSCMHEKCGASGLVATQFKINGEVISSVPGTGEEVENVAQETLKKHGGPDSKLGIHRGTETGHLDSGMVLFLGEKNGIIPDAQKRRMLEAGQGGAYHLGLNIPRMVEFLKERDIEGERAEEFLKTMVRLNFGVSLDIAMGHNDFDNKKNGLHIVSVDLEEVAKNEEEGSIVVREINTLIGNYTQETGITPDSYNKVSN